MREIVTGARVVIKINGQVVAMGLNAQISHNASKPLNEALASELLDLSDMKWTIYDEVGLKLWPQAGYGPDSDQYSHPLIRAKGFCKCTVNFRCDSCLRQFLRETGDRKCDCGTKNPVGQGHSNWCQHFRKEF